MRTSLSTFGLSPYYADNKLSFHERKCERTEYFFKHVFRNKLIECGACSGYCYYCGNKCSFCHGNGVQRERYHYW